MTGANPILALALAAAVAGCAAAEPGFSPPAGKPGKFEALLKTEPGKMTADGRYQLSEHEKTLDCRKIGGIIHVGILQLRESGERHRPSIGAKGASVAVSPILGGSLYGIDPDADAGRTRARIEALNARLAEKSCATFDLTAELAPGNSSDPAPVKAAKPR